MAQRRFYELLTRATRSASVTGNGLFLGNEPAHRAILTVKVYSGGSTGTSPTLDVKIQGAPIPSATLYTAVRAYAKPVMSHTAPCFATFAQATTATTQLKFADYVPRYVRAVATIAGSSPSFNLGVYLDAES